MERFMKRTLGGKDVSRGLAASAPLVLVNGRLESHLLFTGVALAKRLSELAGANSRKGEQGEQSELNFSCTCKHHVLSEPLSKREAIVE